MSEAKDFDPYAVPVRPAATVMIIADRPQLEVLMLERHVRMVFAPGMWVFPGGAVDPGEADEFEPLCDGLNDAQASAILGMKSGGLAYWVAAIRENFEEAGLLLGRCASGVSIDQNQFNKPRQQLHHRQMGFLAIVRELGLILDTRSIHYIARWITPLGSARRFDARFFVSSPPAEQGVVLDTTESAGWMWISPHEALACFTRDEMVMMTPTVCMLRCLAAFSSASEVLCAAKAQLNDHRARVRYTFGDNYTIVLPGDAGYETADETRESGWVRLRPLG